MTGNKPLLKVTNVPAGFQAVAVQTSPTTAVLLLVNTQTGSNDGNGAPGTVDLQLQNGIVTNTQQLTIDASTSVSAGPATQALGAQSGLSLSPAGYAVNLIKFTLFTP